MREVLLDSFHWYRISVVYFNKVELVHQGEGCQTKEGVEHISLITWSVGEAPSSTVFL